MSGRIRVNIPSRPMMLLKWEFPFPCMRMECALFLQDMEQYFRLTLLISMTVPHTSHGFG